MLGFEGRHVEASSSGSRILFAAFEHSVVVRDLVHGTQSARLETTFDYGGRRLALSDELDAVVAAAYMVHGLALYSCASAGELWRRKDIKKVQHISLSRDGLTAYCGRADAPLAVVDLASGETVRTVRGARALHDSQYDCVQLLDGTRPQILDDSGQRKFFVERTTSAFLDVAFAPDLLVLSEVGGPVRAIDLETGLERWRYQPQTGWHVLRLGHREREPSLLGIEWSFKKGGAKRLSRWSLDQGDVIDSLSLGEPIDCCFALGGEIVVTTEGDILDTATATAEKQSSS